MIKSYIFLLLFVINVCFSNDITPQVFMNIKEGIVAAFGDFNSDELTDVFLISKNYRTLEILLGADTEPLLRPGPNCSFKNEIVSIVPGDFDGDALMDVLVTLKSSEENILNVFINWGGIDHLNCSNDASPLFKTWGEPMAIDFNRDMIIDLFGLDHLKHRTFWIFSNDRKSPSIVHQATPNSGSELKIPHANAFLDLNMDYMADLFLQTDKNFEIWTGRLTDKEDFDYYKTINFPMGNYELIIGQSIFLDMELKGEHDQVVPVCFDKNCNNSSILVFEGNEFRDLHVNFKDTQGNLWGFVVPKNNELYSKVITCRSGDFNMDGYPDLLVTLSPLSNPKRSQTFLLENVPCKVCNKEMLRTFEIKWNALVPMGNYNTVAGAFYDFYQDGILDVILIEKNEKGNYRPLAFRNTLDYDANFVKVIVLTGLINIHNSTAMTPLGKKKRTYGTNLPGPRIVYYTTTQEGDNQHGASAQLPQSAYFALQLPYTIFGLGRTPNFVDSLTVGMGNKSRTWTQLIPNSQMFVIPRPIDDPQRWKAQLFVTPSKLILMSVLALGGTCLVIMFIILGLYIKEKREDKKEKLMEANRFNFDAM